MRARHWIRPGVCVASLLAAACGSGGGGGTPTAPVVVTTPAPTTPPATAPPATVAPSPSPTAAPTFQFTAVSLSVDGCTANGSAESSGGTGSSIRSVKMTVTFNLKNKDGQVIHSTDGIASGSRWIYRGPSVKNGTYTLQVEARQSSQLIDRQASGSATARTCG